MARLAQSPSSPSQSSVSSASTAACIAVRRSVSLRRNFSKATDDSGGTCNGVIESATTAQRRRSARLVSIHRSPERDVNETPTALRRRRLACVIELQPGKTISETQLLRTLTPSLLNLGSQQLQRSSSDGTLVGNTMNSPQRQLLNAGIESLDLDWKINVTPSLGPLLDGSKGLGKAKEETPVKRRQSVRLAASATKTAASAIHVVATTLGKRSRDIQEARKDRPLLGTAEDKRATLRRRSEVAHMEETTPGRKRLRLSAVVAPEVDESISLHLKRQQAKLWLHCGLYIGQDKDFDPKLNEAKNRKKRASINGTNPGSLLPMPMFAGEQLLDRGRDFRLPYDIYSPLPPGQPKPDEWRKTRSNIFTPDAASEWKRHKALPPSRCLCTPDNGCDNDCQNRYMLYECTEDNCSVAPQSCGNRSFQDLKERTKSGTKYGMGVEVMKTQHKGFGVRACRSFEPHQIIVEYTGEVITQDECDKRMLNEYRDDECYYFMMFDQNMIIDGTRGSIARFINHSCSPNCRIEKWNVGGKPRMGLFAGDYGVLTGEELTYDYNFDPFSQKNVQICHCGTASCRGVLGPRPKEKETSQPPQKSKPKQALTTLTGAQRRMQSLFSGIRKPVTKSPANKLRKSHGGATTSTVNLLNQKSGPGGRASTSSSRTLVVMEDTPRRLLQCDRATSRSSSRSSLGPRVAGGNPTALSVKRSNTIGTLSRVKSGLRCGSTTARTPAVVCKTTVRNNLGEHVLKSGSNTETRSLKAAPDDDMEDDENARPIDVAEVARSGTVRTRVFSMRKAVLKNAQGLQAATSLDNDKTRKSVRMIKAD